MTERYRHTQIGYLVIVALGLPLLLAALSLASFGFDWIVFAVMVFLGVLLVLFSTLTVSIEEDVLEVRFGPGVIRKGFHLEDIESCEVVKNPWHYGWGIRLTPGGWLFNVSGSHAVEISTRNGKKYRIGTDVPDELQEAIRRAIGTTHG